MSGRIRRRVAAHGERGRGKRLPADLQAEIAAYARRRRAEGASVREIGAETGVSAESIRRWAATPGRARPEAIPVRVLDDESRAKIVVVMPNGVRVEGLDVSETADLLGRLD